MRRIAVVLLAVFALAACSKADPEVTRQEQVPAEERTQAASASESAGEGSAGGATWVAEDIAWADAPAEVPAGTVEVTLNNTGSTLHNLTIDDNVIVEANGGETQTGTIDLKPGTYAYICSVPGHEDLMSGEVEVK